jgi:hypothetical protein
MNTSTISLSDLVKVDRRGREFIAVVTAKEPNGDLQLRPLQRSTYYSARPREVVAHYRAMGRPSNLAPIKTGDVLRADIDGTETYCLVDGRMHKPPGQPHQVTVTPLGQSTSVPIAYADLRERYRRLGRRRA